MLVKHRVSGKLQIKVPTVVKMHAEGENVLRRDQFFSIFQNMWAIERGGEDVGKCENDRMYT